MADVSGLGGIGIYQLVSSLMTSKNDIKISHYQQQLSYKQLENRIAILGDLYQKLSLLRVNLEKLGDTSLGSIFNLSQLSVVSTNPNLVEGTANYNLTNSLSYKVSSYSAEAITGIKGADENTPLYGVSGSIFIQGKEIYLNTAGITDTLNTLKNKINDLEIDVSATISDNRLVLTSLNNKPISVIDDTVGGHANSFGMNRSAFSNPLDATTSSYLHSFNVTVVCLAQKQKNQSEDIREITGNDDADEDTPLGISGSLTINSKIINLSSDYTLEQIKDLINNADAGVSASINWYRLIIEADGENKNYFDLTDNTTGGAKGLGLDIGKISYYATSTSVRLIAGDINADEDTVLTGVSGKLQINGIDIPVGIKAGTDTLARIAEKINQTSGIGVSATISDNKLILTSTNGNPINLSDFTTGGYASGSGALSFVKSDSVISYPQNAIYKVGDNTYSSISNEVSDGLEGVKLTLNSASEFLMNEVEKSTVQVTSYATKKEIETIKKTIENFVKYYNDVIELLNKELSFNVEDKKAGSFFGVGTIIRFQKELIDNITKPVTGIKDSDINSLAKIGIIASEGGALSIDYAKLSAMLSFNPSSVARVFNNAVDGIAVRIKIAVKMLSKYVSPFRGEISPLQLYENFNINKDDLYQGISVRGENQLNPVLKFDGTTEQGMNEKNLYLPFEPAYYLVYPHFVDVSA